MSVCIYLLKERNLYWPGAEIFLLRSIWPFAILFIGKFPKKIQHPPKQILPFISVQFSHSVVSDSLRHHESQHVRPPCPSPTPRVHSNSCPLCPWPSSHLILCRPLLLLPPIPPSFRVSSNESTLRVRWPKYWSFSFSIIPSNEHQG